MKSIGFDHLFSALPSPHMVLDRDLRYVAVNPAYEAAVMRSRSELVGQRLFDMFPSEGEARRRLQESLARVLQTGKRDTLAYIRYEIPRPEAAGGGFEERYWTATHAPLVDEGGEVRFILQNTVDITEMAQLREAAALPFRRFAGEVELVQRAREAEEAYKAIVIEGADFKRMFQQAPGMVAVLHGPNHVFTFANEAFRRFIGDRDVVGMAVREAMPEVEGQGVHEMLDAVFQTGTAESGDGVRVMIRRAPDKGLEEAFMDFSYNPIRDAGGAVTGIFLQGSDRTQSVRADQRQRLLIDELNHRVKNTLSTVQSLARQSFRGRTGFEESRRVFEARIIALSNAHNLLSEGHWEAAEFSDLVRQEMAGFAPAQLTVAGPPVRLTPRAAIALAMVLHELATNAVKHGALNAPEGILAVRWRRAGAAGEDARLVLDWNEECRSCAGASLTPGFGLRMLERIVEGELDGLLDMRIGGKGLVCRMDVSLREVEDIAAKSHA